MGIGATVGSGIFMVTGIVAKEIGPSVVCAYMIAAFACILSGLCYAELSSKYPTSGSAYLYS